jgi:hypothetical protein
MSGFLVRIFGQAAPVTQPRTNTVDRTEMVTSSPQSAPLLPSLAGASVNAGASVAAGVACVAVPQTVGAKRMSTRLNKVYICETYSSPF